MSRNQRIALLATAAVVLVVGYLVLRPDTGEGPAAPSDTVPATPATTTDAKAAKPATKTVVVKGAKPVGGIKKLTFAKGGTIDFVVKSDTTDEVHFHGYDVHRDVKAGGRVRFRVAAKFDGRFVVELENHKTQIAEVEVTP